MFKKDKGFTLIELLAVIVIIAIIFTITFPVLKNIISNARYGAFESSKKGIERAAELYYARNANKITLENRVGYVEIGELKAKKLLKDSIVNVLDNMEISDDTKVLIYKKEKEIEFALQMYNEPFFTWYKQEMIKAVKRDKDNLPVNIGDKKIIELETLMDKDLVDELRLPIDLESRCVGYVEIEKISDKDYDYEAYVDCLTESSTFASHYVSYGGKYLDEFLDVKETSDGGYIAVGKSNSETITKYGIGNNGNYDAIIVKFDSAGNVEWSKNFGGSKDDEFHAVVEGPNGYVAVGTTCSDDGDIEDYKGGINDAIIVEYNFDGEVIYKKSYGSNNSHGERFTDIIMDGNQYVLVGNIAGSGMIDGDLEGVTGLVSGTEGIILKTDLNFNTIWRNFFVGSLYESFIAIKKTIDNNYIVVGWSDSSDYDMEGLGVGDKSRVAITVKYDQNGNLLAKTSFKGTIHWDSFNDLLEVEDGYILVGYSESADLDMDGLSKASNGYKDAIIVKYDKNLENIIWKKSFGGSDDDEFKSIVKYNNNEVLVVGYSKSNDMDMAGLPKTPEGYRNAILVKYNIQNGEVLDKKVFGGSNSESFSSIIKTANGQYVVAGVSYSNDTDLKNFNKGHADAILVKYDSDLNLKKEFEEPVVIIDKIKPIIPNYGTEISLRYDNIYTTNDPTADLKNWCSSYEVYTEGNTSNYYYWCLEPFNSDDRKVLVAKEMREGLKFYQGEHEYLISKSMDNNRNWIQLHIYAGGYTGGISFSNLKLKFADGYVSHITDAINKGYIEPLVIVNSWATSSLPHCLFPSVIDIINENGNTGVGIFPTLRVWFKPKKSEFMGIKLTSSKSSEGTDYLSIYELRNFDISITPTN